MAGKVGREEGAVVALVSGGNIAPERLAALLIGVE
jgi:hypothetical protein